MRRVIAIAIVLLVCGSVFGQGSAPAPPDWDWQDSASMQWIITPNIDPDSTTDQAAALQAVIDSANQFGGIVLLRRGVYRLEDSLVVDSCMLDLRAGADLKFVLSDSDRAVCIGPHGHIIGGRVRVTGATSGSGGRGAAVSIGDYNVDAPGPDYWSVQDIDLSTDKTDGIAVIGLGASNGLIRGVHVGTNSNLIAAISLHWSGPHAGADTSTFHPHNIVIENCVIDTMTKAASVAVRFAGAYACRVSNVYIGKAVIAVYDYCGDLGYYFADTNYLDTASIDEANTFENIVAHQAGTGIWFSGLAKGVYVGDSLWPIMSVATNCIMQGQGAGTYGAYLASCKNAVIQHSQFWGFATDGIYLDSSDGSVAFNNRIGGSGLTYGINVAGGTNTHLLQNHVVEVSGDTAIYLNPGSVRSFIGNSTDEAAIVKGLINKGNYVASDWSSGGTLRLDGNAVINQDATSAAASISFRNGTDTRVLSYRTNGMFMFDDVIQAIGLYLDTATSPSADSAAVTIQFVRDSALNAADANVDTAAWNAATGYWALRDSTTLVYVNDSTGDTLAYVQDTTGFQGMKLYGNIAVGDTTTGDKDGYVYFGDDGAWGEYMMWNDGEGKFEFSDNIWTGGTVTGASVIAGTQVLTCDSMGVDTDGDGTVDNYLYSTTAGAFHIKKGANITLTVAGDTVTVAGPAASGTADSMGVDTDGDGTVDNYLYSTVAGAFHLKEGSNITLTVAGDTVEIAGAAGAGTVDSVRTTTPGATNYDSWSKGYGVRYYSGFSIGGGDSSGFDTVGVTLKITSGLDTTGGYVVAKPGTGIDTTGGTINHSAHTGDVTGATALTIAANAVESTMIGVDQVNDLDINFGSGTDQVDTDDLTEGSSNLYNQTHTGDVTGSVALTIAGNAVESTMIGPDEVNDLDINFGSGTDQVNSDDVPVGSSNLYNQTHTGDVTGATELTIAANAVESTMIGADQVNDLDINFGTGTDQVSTDDITEGTKKFDQALPDSANWSKGWDTLQLVLDDTTTWKDVAAKFDTNYAQITLATVLGAVDAGGATSLEIPNGTAPAPTNAGEIFWDTDDDALEATDGTNDFLIATKADVFIVIIDNPDQLACDTMKIPIRGNFPGGIVIDSIGILTSTSTSYSCVFEEWTDIDHSTGTEASITTVATSSNFEAVNGAIAHTVEYDNLIAIDLDADDIDQVTIWIRYYMLGKD